VQVKYDLALFGEEAQLSQRPHDVSCHWIFR